MSTNNGAIAERCRTCTRFGGVEWSILDDEGLRDLWSGLHTKQYAAGATIFSQHDNSEGIYCLEEGRILLRRFDMYGAEIGFRLIINGGTLGWRSFFAEERHASNALALTDCKICLLQGSTVRRLIGNDSNLAQAFLKTLARDPGPQDAIMLRSPHVPVRTRLMQLLAILIENYVDLENPDRCSFDLPIKRVQVASMIGARSETLSRAIKELNEMDLAHFDGKHVTIPSLSTFSEAIEKGSNVKKE